MSERFVRLGIEIPLSIYSNLDKIKNGSAASGRILEAVKREKDYYDNSRFAHLDTYEESVYDERYSKNYDLKKHIKNSIYGEMKENNDETEDD